ncbi:MAG TPA: LPS assembly protein LptD [Candidatus Paceibacterota bacterium]|nr:LPS assembly protein LptD [Candidatus Paceibacterota bacterium]
MSCLRIICTLALGWLALPGLLPAQRLPDWEIEALGSGSGVIYDFQTGIAMATNGVLVRYGTAVLTAEQVAVHQTSGEVIAEGRVRIQQDDQIWASEHIRYNFLTRQMQSRQFRTGKLPVFASGQNLEADLTNRIYTATNALITTEDFSQPLLKLRARSIRIIPGEKVVARDATLYVGQVPVFYFPYYSRKLGPRSNHFTFTPGYRGSYGAYLLSSYLFYLSDDFDGAVHVDYRTERGVGLGPDLNYNLGRWGHGTIKYYYLHDQDPNASIQDIPIPEDRQRVWFSYQAMPATNLQLLSVVRYQSDLGVTRDFFESEYRQNPQPSTFFEATKFWDNFSLDLYAQPRINDFLETVERLPEIRLTGYRQQLGPTPFYYESESSAGYYRRRFAEDTGIYGPAPGLNYEAARADTYHQVLLPQTFFGWLNITPRVGGRFTYYSEASGPGGTTDEASRGVFNTGAEATFKVSRLWPGIQNKLFDMDGVRHIVEPSVNYVYVPRPSPRPPELPQFDMELPTLRLLSLEFPDYNAIDSIDSQNAVRFGLRNRLQTKRRGQVVDVVSWDLYTDWRLRPRPDQDTFPDIFSDVLLRPRQWLTLESLTRYDVASGQFRLALHSFRLQPNEVWSWGLTHFYLRDDLSEPGRGLGLGNNNLMSTFFVRLNEDWGARASHYFNVRDGRLQEQLYTLYRDLRSWTAALTCGLRDNLGDNPEFIAAFTFSLKAFPRYQVGADTVAPYTLLGF